MEYIEKLKIFVSLARVDGEVTEKERQYIINVGQANHLLIAEILPLFSSEHPMVVPNDMTQEQKFEYILHLVQLMKIDDKLYREEIKYCAQVAARLGYQEEVLFELMLSVKNTVMDSNEVETLRKLTARYLRAQ